MSLVTEEEFLRFVTVDWGKGYDYFFFFRAKEEVGGSFGMTLAGRDIDRRGFAADSSLPRRFTV